MSEDLEPGDLVVLTRSLFPDDPTYALVLGQDINHGQVLIRPLFRAPNDAVLHWRSLSEMSLVLKRFFLLFPDEARLLGLDPPRIDT